ncbi:hypothetical protein [Halorussus salinus]|uniref:hypothetical protein n=1 Tax=Halorussus salinus TaxID=1364935 RepID=UPI00109224C8|nr:hypothetical protein [Halorussus salinus]
MNRAVLLYKYVGECPHGKDLNDCRAARKTYKAYECPSAVSPHPIRRSAINDYLDRGVPKHVVTERMNVSKRVLDQHYYEQSHKQAAENKKRHLDNL